MQGKNKLTVKRQSQRDAHTRTPVAENVWRMIETPACPGARNMAIDMVLAESVRAGAIPTLRFYRWWPPCISLGRNQPAKERYDAAEAQRRGIEFVRRPTGGRAVYHHHEITYSVAIAERQLGGPRRTYEAIHRAIHAGLRLLGAPTELVEAQGQAIRPSTLPCFRELERGAIIANRRKLVGSAQLREGGVILQHGSILLAADQSPTVNLLNVKRPSDEAEPPTALDELLPSLPTWHELVDSLASGFERLIGIKLWESTLEPQEKARLTFHSRRFSDANWTWRL